MDTAALIDDHTNGLFTGVSDTGRDNAKLAIFCSGTAFVLAMAETVTSIFDRFPVPLSLPIFGMMTVAIGSREIAARSRLSQQTRHNASSRRELEAKNRWFSVTEAHARVGHWRLDLTTNEVFWSDATFAIHGLKPSHPPSLNDAINFYHKDDRSYVVQTIERARETGQPYNFRARIITPGGETRHVEAAASVECTSDGTPAALFGVVKDRTGEEAMQADLRQARDQANALASAKGQFLSRMSHEIRTPMNGLLGFAELLELSQLSAEQRRHTELIIGSAKSLQLLLNDILDLSKIEAGKPDIRYGETDVSAALQSVIATSAKLAQHKGIKLVTDIGPGVPPKINVDAARLRQILCNLVSNSVRFTDTGIVSLAASKDGDGLSFSVTDTGAGIEPHRRDSIFTFSNQDQSNPTDLKNGTGLGLAMSRQLARLMGGDLTVRSEFGQGSIFTLTLPDHADHVLASTASDSQDVAHKA
ncbi:ATP-binding protein [Erythrobacter sp. Alg231-14]|uniref:ATP-binding protein n=1 Tax=Erythrobacter sp. Alg231-14 TaxID=1922225 RepID=UPI000D555FD2